MVSMLSESLSDFLHERKHHCVALRRALDADDFQDLTNRWLMANRLRASLVTALPSYIIRE